MRYAEAVEYLNSFINFERVPDSRFDTSLDDLMRFRILLQRLGNPQREYPVIHIAGTKGKGSTAAILSGVLRAAGYHVGLFTSPHLVTVRERIRVDGGLISTIEFAALVRRLAEDRGGATVGRRSYRTVFEHLTAMALLHFARRRVDIAVIEAGLGGRLDATTVLEPALAVLTPIGLDHTQVLGDTISAIAADKAHAIKPGVPAVTAPQHPDAMERLRTRAAAVGARLVEAPGRGEFLVERADLRGTVFSDVRGQGDAGPIHLPLAGMHQLENVSTVSAAVEVLRGEGFEIAPEKVVAGLERVRLEGRLQWLPRRRVILDGAHNALSFGAVREALDLLVSGRRLRLVFSALKNKPVPVMLAKAADLVERAYIAPLAFPKGEDISALADAATTAGVDFRRCRSVPEALHRAEAERKRGELILVAGSFYLVGETLRELRGLPPPPDDGRIDPAL